ncbi:hypothetical protein [Lacisediminimonas sp.]|uniref:hypothetical protein n=1 Tax=Lacisediminimonas sp. TaxID=3060582 RepID=UPI002715DCFF|nr:hypothetical protein [Lacisediminimonas sp.]MDO8299923.1 hypothetical protein [Lacisediminimonas sp.]MDO9219368.1 hypothetical protein [Lacisediminimonas sp.]
MGILSITETDDAVSGLSALREVMADDLLDVESRLDELERSSATLTDGKNDEALVYRTARTALLSGLASIDEVLGWVHLVAEKDADGNELESVLSLPHLSVMRAS